MLDALISKTADSERFAIFDSSHRTTGDFVDRAMSLGRLREGALVPCSHPFQVAKMAATVFSPCHVNSAMVGVRTR